MTTDTIIKILLVAPFAAIGLWAIRLRLRLKKIGVKVSEEHKPSKSIVSYASSYTDYATRYKDYVGQLNDD
ncbi:MAG: hypothetical protein M0Z48_10410 [Nitrospiraceae bacterium]|nr:hypothetical protein [Nitrospiraceae bacterium]